LPSACGVIGYDPFLTEARAQALGIELAADLDSVYRDADFITVHMPVTEQTRGMLNSSAFSENEAQGAPGELCPRRNHRGEGSARCVGFGQNCCGRVGCVCDGTFAFRPSFSHASVSDPYAAFGASTQEAQEKCGIEVAEVIAAYLLTGEVRNAVNLPYLDAETYEQVRPYLVLGEKLGRFLAQLAPPQVDRLHITYGGKAKELPNIDPITRSILMGFLSRAAVKDLNNVNVRTIASTLGLTVEEKRSNEPVTFNEWLHIQVSNGGLETDFRRWHIFRIAR
jgi:D-3-phosphoglycerate dehydrogenase